ncbi:sel1 repeat family protein, partial [Paracoccaceae bacterium]|nr:sel1 repeat family protein [Paracoccaceae bacterium]
MCFRNKRLGSFVALISAFIVGQQALSQSAIPEDKCAIITGATKDTEVALKAIEKFKDYVPVVIESTNGYLAPSIGIYYKDGSKELVEGFKKDKIIPDDSYCGNADRFVSVLYPNQNFTALTTNPPSLIAQYGYVGKWSADPNDCNIKYDYNSISLDDKSVNFGPEKFCSVKDQRISPEGPLRLTIEMVCFEEGEEFEDVLSLILQAKDKVLIPDTGQNYTRCEQIDQRSNNPKSFEQLVYNDDIKDRLTKGKLAYDAGEYAKAFRNLFPLSEEGYPSAQTYIGLMYAVGTETIPQNSKEAFTLFSLAAEQGNARAQNALGYSYEIGSGVMVDFEQALKWYELSAQSG